jgi:hypothetical protein
MDQATIYKTALLLHYIGFTVMVGATLSDFMASRQFWKAFAVDRGQAAVMKQATARFPMLIGLGALILLTGGITMVVLMHGMVKPQLWFPIKLFLVLILLLNGMLAGRRNGMKLVKYLAAKGENPPFEKLKKRMSFFYVSQLMLLLAVFVLSAYRFQ